MDNALTIDVEEHFQVAALAEAINYSEWDEHASRVVANTSRIMDLMDSLNVKATFFTLGWVAERHPKLVENIAARGHEVASHGYSHQLIYDQSIDVFREETLKSKKILEDIIGEEVIGYRAASYSITKKSLWALDVLVEAGFKYDSSIFPIYHDRYGIPDAEKIPHVLTTPGDNQIVEFPLSTSKFVGMNLPAAGGGYFRLYPYWLSKHLLKNLQSKKQPFVFYLHPWEVDPDQPKVDVGWKSKFRHYNNLHKCETRLSQLLQSFPFTTMKSVLQKNGLLS
ncbi:MAG: DUF3473 domain-containing protein [Gammaproteobacteria bacterium]|nr:DUF3473 domain-containing protein [Gammaproteobacteria bacterium]